MQVAAQQVDGWKINYYCLAFKLSARKVVAKLMEAAHISGDTVVCTEPIWVRL